MNFIQRLFQGQAKPDAAAQPVQRAQARYLRDTKSGVIQSRMAPLTDHREDVRRSWSRVAGLSMDLIQNSGRLKGATDQVLADTVGVGLTLTPDPDLSGMGYDEKGEATGVFDFFTAGDRSRYGITSGTKLCLVPPPRLVQDTSPLEGLFQGVRHDGKSRPVSYRFETVTGGLKSKRDYAAFDADGRPLVMHVFDPMDATDVRGISLLAPAFRKHIQAEMLDDATLQMAILQTVFAITLTSEAPSQDAYEALEVLKESEGGTGYAQEYLDFLGAQLDRAAESRISVGADPQVSHLGPGEKLGMETAKVPGQDFLPFSNSLARDMARTIGITYGGLTMDHTAATYSSVRMENASIWAVVMRRRERIAAPMCQMVYSNWLDEEVGEGRIPFKGGYEAFRANRDRVAAANWQGPAKPTADDYKSARASTERLSNGTSSIANETGDLGVDPDALFEQRQREHQRYVDAGMESPYAARISQPVIETEPAP